MPLLKSRYLTQILRLWMFIVVVCVYAGEFGTRGICNVSVYQLLSAYAQSIRITTANFCELNKPLQRHVVLWR